MVEVVVAGVDVKRLNKPKGRQVITPSALDWFVWFVGVAVVVGVFV